MTRKEIEAGKNEMMQAFMALSKEARDAIAKARKQSRCESLGTYGNWIAVEPSWECGPGCIYRINPDTPADDETQEGCEDVRVMPMDCIGGKVYASNEGAYIFTLASNVGFVGIGYELDGVVTVHPTMNPEFGIPKFVRMRKACNA